MTKMAQTLKNRSLLPVFVVVLALPFLLELRLFYWAVVILVSN